MNQKFKLLAMSALVASLATPVAAMAISYDLTFDPTGTAGAAGDIAGVAVFDQKPGNALAQGGVTAVTNQIINQTTGSSLNTGFTLLYQANLNTAESSLGSTLFSNGTGGNFFTFVAGFGERVTNVSGSTATFGFDGSNSTNFFNMYATSASANNLAGTGFLGTQILSAHVIDITAASFTANTNTSVNLDSFGADNWSGQQTVTGSGSTDITFMIDSFDVNYFPDLVAGLTSNLSFFNTSNIDPFRQVDPSKCINSTSANCDAATGITPDIGALNGSTGPDILLQADGNQSFVIPEPGTMALFGIGISLLGLSSKRKQA